MPTSVLSDGTIRRLVDEGRIVIDPWDEKLVQPASVDLRLGDSFRVFHNHRTTAIDLREPPTNLTRVPIKLYAGLPIAQLSFMALDRPAERPYGHPELGSHYHGQVEATESRYEGGPARRVSR